MTPFGSADLDIFLADMGVDVTYNGVTAKGIFSQNQEFANSSFDHGFQKSATRILIKTGALPGIADDVQITADGVGYRVRAVDLAIPDAAFTRLTVAPLV